MLFELFYKPSLNVLTAETCWALNEYWIYNKISGIKLVSFYSTIKMMHGPINIRFFSETFLNLRWIQRDMIILYIDLHKQHSVFMSDFNESSNFPKDFFSKITSIANFIKFCPVAVELSHKEGRRMGQTDRRSDRYSKTCLTWPPMVPEKVVNISKWST